MSKSRGLCYVPAGGSGVETCTRTFHGLPLLRPGPETDERIVGCFGRAQEYARVRLMWITVLSNHVHAMYRVDHALQMAAFQCHLNSNIAREIGRLHDWWEKLWGRRYRPMVLSDEPEVYLKRLKYLISHGVKENLVAEVTEWPGINSVKSILEGKPLVGYWFNREQEWKARRRGEVVKTYDYATRYEIELARPPCFEHLTVEEYRELILSLVREVEEEAAARRGNGSVVGVAAILAQDPLEPLPSTPKKSPAPRLFCAFAREVAESLERHYYDEFLQRHRFASSLLRVRAIEGENPAVAMGFPQGSFPPGLPFLGAPPLPCPPSPPTRRLEYLADGTCLRGPIPVIRISGHSLERMPEGGGEPPPEDSASEQGARERREQRCSRDPPS